MHGMMKKKKGYAKGGAMMMKNEQLVLVQFTRGQGYYSKFREKNKRDQERQEYIDAFKEKTEELRYKNEQAKLAREKRMIWNQTHGVDQRRF